MATRRRIVFVLFFSYLLTKKIGEIEEKFIFIILVSVFIPFAINLSFT